jgi:hypothetical protein
MLTSGEIREIYYENENRGKRTMTESATPAISTTDLLIKLATMREQLQRIRGMCEVESSKDYTSEILKAVRIALELEDDE